MMDSLNKAAKICKEHKMGITDCIVMLDATLKALGDYNDTLLHEDDCDARYDDEDNARCNCSKGHIESLLNRSKGQGD